MTNPNALIGSSRKARDLKPGDHVRLGDGRWALVVGDVLVSKPLATSGDRAAFASVGLLVNQRDTEGGSWRADDLVWSRSPAQQIQAMESLISDLREKALAAAGGVR